MAKRRIDEILIERGLASSIEKARALILAGEVLVNDAPVDKAGAQVAEDSQIRLRSEPQRFVSRGGEKLEGALEYFKLNIKDRIVIDVGSSTGGFTDCLLQRGAKQIYAVDVGKAQLDYRLRKDARVVVMEELHARDLSPALFSLQPTLAVIDVSFISLRKILEPVVAVLKQPFEILALVKPQFELEAEEVQTGGVVIDPAEQQRAVNLVKEFAVARGLEIVGETPSVLRGAKSGNQEYFLYLRSNQ